METTVELQNPFSYSVIPMIVIGSLLLAYIIYRILERYLMKQKKQKEEEAARPEPKVIDLAAIKSEYLEKICDLEKRFQAGEIENREAYIEVSSIFRNFVYDATGVEAPKYTLHDIRGLDMPVLYSLVNEYYEPEFSVNSKGDILKSIDTTKKAVERWN